MYETNICKYIIKQCKNNWIMVPVHPLGLLALSTLYISQKISHSWTTPQVILHTWESLSDTSYLDSSFSKIYK